MKIKTITHVFAFLTLYLCSNSTQALHVHFAKASSKPEKASLRELYDWLATYDGPRGALVVLRGHTDVDADESYNLKLSKRRNDAVQEVLKRHGFTRFDLSYYGESWPVCNSGDEYCMHQNRRVEVVILNEDEEAFLGHEKRGREVHFHENAEEAYYTLNGGCKLHIPADAFVDEYGRPVPQVRIETVEYLDPVSCIKGHMTCTTKDDLLRTGGMIYVKAYDGWREVKLAPDASIGVVFPSQAAAPDTSMRAYVGEQKNGIIEWKLDVRAVPQDFDPYSRRFLNKKGKYEREFVVRGSNVIVEYAKNEEPYAYYAQLREGDGGLTTSEREELKQLVYYGRDISELRFSSLGWFNCDALFKYPNRGEQTVACATDLRLRYYLVMDQARCIVSGKSANDGKVVFENIPRGMKGQIIAYGYMGDESILSIKDIMTGDQTETLELRTVASKDVDALLKEFTSSGSGRIAGI